MLRKLSVKCNVPKCHPHRFRRTCATAALSKGMPIEQVQKMLGHEENEHVPTWNHEIMLEELPGNRCRYTDKVDIDAGWKTIFIWMWANCFYDHRQRKWIKMLS